MRWPLRRHRVQAAPTLVDDGSLVVLARAPDPAEGDGPAVARLVAAGHPGGAPVLLRHVFEATDADAPSARVLGAMGDLLTVDGYAVTAPEPRRVYASRTVTLTVLGAAQERARMTGLTTRIPVDYLGWEALAKPPG